MTEYVARRGDFVAVRQGATGRWRAGIVSSTKKGLVVAYADAKGRRHQLTEDVWYTRRTVARGRFRLPVSEVVRICGYRVLSMPKMQRIVRAFLKVGDVAATSVEVAS